MVHSAYDKECDMMNWKQIKENWKKPRQPTRYNDDYVIRKEWMFYPMIFSNIGFLIIGIGGYYIASIFLPKTLQLTPYWPIDLTIIISPMGVWLFFAYWKIFPFILKKFNWIIYSPKNSNDRPFRHGVEQ